MATSQICSIPDCGKRRHSNGMCSTHYSRQRRRGDPYALRPNARASFIDQVAVPHDDDACLIWPFSTFQSTGYGQVKYKGKQRSAHRLVCELVYGPPSSDRHDAAHSCGVRACVNPRHLRWASAKENHADKITHGTKLLGENVPYSKLTEADIHRIRTLIREGSLSSREIGVLFNVSKATIKDIKHRRTWEWL